MNSILFLRPSSLNTGRCFTSFALLFIVFQRNSISEIAQNPSDFNISILRYFLLFSLKIPFTGRISEEDCFIIVKFYKSLQPIKTKFSFHLLHSNTVCEYVKHHSICPVTILPTFIFCHIQVLEIVYNLP